MKPHRYLPLLFVLLLIGFNALAQKDTGPGHKQTTPDLFTSPQEPSPGMSGHEKGVGDTEVQVIKVANRTGEVLAISVADTKKSVDWKKASMPAGSIMTIRSAKKWLRIENKDSSYFIVPLSAGSPYSIRLENGKYVIK